MITGMPLEAATISDRTLREIGTPFERNAPIGPRTWYGVGGEAEVLAKPETVEQLARLVAHCKAEGIPLRVLGKGANLLVPEGVVGGVVVVLEGAVFRRREVKEGSKRIVAGGGADLEKLITDTVRVGLSGLDSLGGVPATVGGALCMNAGGRYGEIGMYVVSATVIEPDGVIRKLTKEEMGFSYRHSNLGGRIVVEAELELSLAPDPAEPRRRLKEIMGAKAASQPMAAPSAGCAFKNPPKELGFKGAGWLIEQAGLKGFRVGGAEVSPEHANFIVLHKGGKAADVVHVMRHVIEVVEQKFGVRLVREVVVWE
jgi:UDP-N-acetylmuramate dehydrogenase